MNELPGVQIVDGLIPGVLAGGGASQAIALDDGGLLVGGPDGAHRTLDVVLPAGLPAPPVPTLANVRASGTWTTIVAGHRLDRIGPDRVVDWVPATRAWRLWRLDPAADDPLPDPRIAAGTWTSIGTGHRLLWLGGDRVLDWQDSGAWRLFTRDDTLAFNDPLPGPATASGTWPDISAGHRLVALPDGRVLDHNAATGALRIFMVDLAGPEVLVRPPVVETTLPAVGPERELLALPGGDLLDWDPTTGAFRVWRPSAAAVPPGYPTVSLGDNNDNVTTLQRGLLVLGYFAGLMNGVFGPDTQTAVQTFQAGQGLPVTGAGDEATWARLLDLLVVAPRPAHEPGIVIAQFDRSVDVSVANDPHAGGWLRSGTGADLSAVESVLVQFGLQSAGPAFELPASTMAHFNGLAIAQGASLPAFTDFLRLRFTPAADVLAASTALSDLPGVVRATPRYAPVLCARPNDPLVGTNDIPAQVDVPAQWYVFRCQADRAWELATGAGVLMCIVDSGFRLDHDDLAPNVSLADAYDLDTKTHLIQPPKHRHGTAVAGFAAAAGNNGTMIAGFAYASTIVPIEWARDSGAFVVPRIVDGILYAAMLPQPVRRVINLSLGLGANLPNGNAVDLTPETDPTIAHAIRLVTVLGQAVVCVAAGNSNTDASLDATGAAVPDAGSIIVAATLWDVARTNPKLSFSNWGARVDMCAPGDPNNDITLHHQAVNRVQKAGATSFATPKVAGTAALMLSANPKLTVGEVRDILRRTGSMPSSPNRPIGSFLNAGAAVIESLHRRLVASFGQQGWRWCARCQGLSFGPGVRCPAGGPHNGLTSANYVLVANAATPFGESHWRWCSACLVLFYQAAGAAAVCPAGGVHNGSSGADYTLALDGPTAYAQGGWRRCGQCAGLFYTGGAVGVCPAGGPHVDAGAGDYTVKFQ